MKHLKELITERFNMTKRGTDFLVELERNGLMTDRDDDGIGFIQAFNGWSLGVRFYSDFFIFYPYNGRKTALAKNDELEKEQLIYTTKFQLSHDHSKMINGQPCYDYSKENAKILAELLNNIK